MVVDVGKVEFEEDEDEEAKGSFHPPLEEPSSYVVVSGLTGAGVTGGGGLPHPTLASPTPRNLELMADNKGYWPWQQTLLKSSRSSVQTAAPPYPF